MVQVMGKSSNVKGKIKQMIEELQDLVKELDHCEESRGRYDEYEKDYRSDERYRERDDDYGHHERYHSRY